MEWGGSERKPDNPEASSPKEARNEIIQVRERELSETNVCHEGMIQIGPYRDFKCTRNRGSRGKPLKRWKDWQGARPKTEPYLLCDDEG